MAGGWQDVGDVGDVGDVVCKYLGSCHLPGNFSRSIFKYVYIILIMLVNDIWRDIVNPWISNGETYIGNIR